LGGELSKMMKEPKTDFGWLLQRLRASRGYMVFGFLCALLVGVTVTLDPLLMRSLIDHALPEHNLSLALKLVSGIGLCYLGRSALSGLGSLTNHFISQQCVRDLRTALMNKMNRLSADYHEQTPMGEKLTRIEHDVDEIANLGADTANQSVRALVFFTFNLVMMAKLSFQMTLTILPLFPLFAIVQYRFSHKLKARADAVRVEVGSANSLLAEPLGATSEIQLLGAEESTEQRAASKWERMLRAQVIQRQNSDCI
jgi:ABC-type bacteriocin/lantibiotic exporter with double-glycine peptidase domain